MCLNKLQSEKGAITIEYAFCIPVVIALLLLVLSFVNYFTDFLKCENAASTIVNFLTEESSGSVSSLSDLNVAINSNVNNSIDIGWIHGLVDGNFKDNKPVIEVSSLDNCYAVKVGLKIHDSLFDFIYPEINTRLVGCKSI